VESGRLWRLPPRSCEATRSRSWTQGRLRCAFPAMRFLGRARLRDLVSQNTPVEGPLPLGAYVSCCSPAEGSLQWSWLTPRPGPDPSRLSTCWAGYSRCRKVRMYPDVPRELARSALAAHRQPHKPLVMPESCGRLMGAKSPPSGLSMRAARGLLPAELPVSGARRPTGLVAGGLDHRSPPSHVTGATALSCSRHFSSRRAWPGVGSVRSS
jgi:hypothetical protein